MAKNTSVLVYGAAGSLGRAVVKAFRNRGSSVLGIDLIRNEDCDRGFVQLNPSFSGKEQQKFVTQELFSQGAKDSSAMLCVSGGWAGGNAAADELLENTENMISSSLYASLVAAHVCAKGFVKPDGCLLLPGAAPLLPAKAATPFMIPYGVAKAAVHQLIYSLASDHEVAGLPKDLKVFGIAPQTLDTEMNRKNMPDADFSTWTSLDTVAEKMVDWAANPQTIEHGKIYHIKTAAGKTEYV